MHTTALPTACLSVALTANDYPLNQDEKFSVEHHPFFWIKKHVRGAVFSARLTRKWVRRCSDCSNFPVRNDPAANAVGVRTVLSFLTTSRRVGTSACDVNVPVPRFAMEYMRMLDKTMSPPNSDSIECRSWQLSTDKPARNSSGRLAAASDKYTGALRLTFSIVLDLAISFTLTFSTIFFALALHACGCALEPSLMPVYFNLKTIHQVM